ncbi:MAG: ion transporter [Firmicutes bacterium]|nr:ion transporter [Bacillota bacterium]
MSDKINSAKRMLFHVLEGIGTKNEHRIGRYVNAFLMLLIAINIASVILASDTQVYYKYSNQLRIIEVISIIIFTVEYILRFWVCSVNPMFRGLNGKILYFMSPFAFPDFLALLHFYIPGVVVWDLRFLRIIRFGKMTSMLRVSKYSHAIRTLFRVLHKKREAIRMSVSFVLTMLIISSCFIYYIEHDAQPKAFSSIPASMWWSVITLTTIGYGDMYPITPLGKFFGALVAFFGVGLFALPAAIFGSGLIEEMELQKRRTTCPFCGKRSTSSFMNNNTLKNEDSD